MHDREAIKYSVEHMGDIVLSRETVASSFIRDTSRTQSISSGRVRGAGATHYRLL